MIRHTINTGGLNRTYLLFVPSVPSGIVVFLHGKGGTADWADSETGWSEHARKKGYALVLPEALPPDPLNPSKFLTNPQQWNDLTEFSRDHNGSVEVEPHENFSAASAILGHDDVAFLTAVIDDVLNRVGTNPAKVFMAGFSNGAGMTFRFAAERADRVTAIAAISGHCNLTDPKPSRPVPTLFAVGTLDPLIPLRGGTVRSPWLNRLVQRPPVIQTLEVWARSIGCSTIPIVRSESAGVRTDIYPGPVPFQSVTIEGLGHHWPGGKGQLNHRIAGPQSNVVNGTEMVWEFFRQFV